MIKFEGAWRKRVGEVLDEVGEGMHTMDALTYVTVFKNTW